MLAKIKVHHSSMNTHFSFCECNVRSILARSKKCVSAHKAGARFHFASAKLLNNLDILPQKSQKLQKNIRFLHKTVKIQLFLKIFLDFLAGYRKSLYLCTRKQETTVSDIAKQTLGYGVMVTLQILVLPFLVRVRVSQQER